MTDFLKKNFDHWGRKGYKPSSIAANYDTILDKAYDHLKENPVVKRRVKDDDGNVSIQEVPAFYDDGTLSPSGQEYISTHVPKTMNQYLGFEPGGIGALMTPDVMPLHEKEETYPLLEEAKTELYWESQAANPREAEPNAKRNQFVPWEEYTEIHNEKYADDPSKLKLDPDNKQAKKKFEEKQKADLKYNKTAEAINRDPSKFFEEGQVYAEIDGEFHLHPGYALDAKAVTEGIQELDVPEYQKKMMLDSYRRSYNSQTEEVVQAVQLADNAARLSGGAREAAHAVGFDVERTDLASLNKWLDSGKDLYSYALNNKMPSDFTGMEQAISTIGRGVNKAFMDVNLGIQKDLAKGVQKVSGSDKYLRAVADAGVQVSGMDQAMKDQFKKSGSFTVPFTDVEITTHDLADVAGQLVMYGTIGRFTRGAGPSSATMGSRLAAGGKSLATVAPTSYFHSSGASFGSNFNERLMDAYAQGGEVNEKEILDDAYADALVHGLTTMAVTSGFQMAAAAAGVSGGVESFGQKLSKNNVFAGAGNYLGTKQGHRMLVKELRSFVSKKGPRKKLAKAITGALNEDLKSSGFLSGLGKSALGVGFEFTEEYTDELLGDLLAAKMVDGTPFFTALEEAGPELWGNYLKAGILGALGAGASEVFGGIGGFGKAKKDTGYIARASADRAISQLNNRAEAQERLMDLDLTDPSQFDEAVSLITAPVAANIGADQEVKPLAVKLDKSTNESTPGVSQPVAVGDSGVMGRATAPIDDQGGKIPVVQKTAKEGVPVKTPSGASSTLPLAEGESTKSSPIAIVMNKLLGQTPDGQSYEGEIEIDKKGESLDGNKLKPGAEKVTAKKIYATPPDGGAAEVVGFLVETKKGNRKRHNYYTHEELGAAIDNGTLNVSEAKAAKFLEENAKPTKVSQRKFIKQLAPKDEQAEPKKKEERKPEGSLPPIRVRYEGEGGFTSFEDFDNAEAAQDWISSNKPNVREVVGSNAGAVSQVNQSLSKPESKPEATPEVDEEQEMQETPEGETKPEEEALPGTEEEAPVESFRERIKRQAKEARAIERGRTSMIMSVDPASLKRQTIIAIDILLDGVESFADFLRKFRKAFPNQEVSDAQAKRAYDEAQKVIKKEEGKQPETEQATDERQEFTGEPLPMHQADSYFISLDDPNLAPHETKPEMFVLTRSRSAASVVTGEVVAIEGDNSQVLVVNDVEYTAEGQQRITFDRRSAKEIKALSEKHDTYPKGLVEKVSDLLLTKTKFGRTEIRKAVEAVMAELYPGRFVQFAKADGAAPVFFEIKDGVVQPVTIDLDKLGRVLAGDDFVALAGNEKMTPYQRRVAANQAARVIARALEEDLIHYDLVKAIKDGAYEELTEEDVVAFLNEAKGHPALGPLVEAAEMKTPDQENDADREFAVGVEVLTAFAQLVRSGATFGSEWSDLNSLAKTIRDSIISGTQKHKPDELTLFRVVSQFLNRLAKATQAFMVKFGLSKRSRNTLANIETLINAKTPLTRGIDSELVTGEFEARRDNRLKHLFGNEEKTREGVVDKGFYAELDGLNALKEFLLSMEVPYHHAFVITDDEKLDIHPVLREHLKKFPISDRGLEVLAKVENYLKILNEGQAAKAYHDSLFYSRLAYESAVADLEVGPEDALASDAINDPRFWDLEGYYTITEGEVGSEIKRRRATQKEASELFEKRKQELQKALRIDSERLESKWRSTLTNESLALQRQTSIDLETIQGIREDATEEEVGEARKRLDKIIKTIPALGQDANAKMERGMDPAYAIGTALDLANADMENRSNPLYNLLPESAKAFDELSKTRERESLVRELTFSDIGHGKIYVNKKGFVLRKSDEEIEHDKKLAKEARRFNINLAVRKTLNQGLWFKVKRVTETKAEYNNLLEKGMMRLLNSQRMDREGFGQDIESVAADPDNQTEFGFTYFTSGESIVLGLSNQDRYDQSMHGHEHNMTDSLARALRAEAQRRGENPNEVIEKFFNKSERLRSNAAYLGRRTMQDAYASIIRGVLPPNITEFFSIGGFGARNVDENERGTHYDVLSDMDRYRELNHLFSLQKDLRDALTLAGDIRGQLQNEERRSAELRKEYGSIPYGEMSAVIANKIKDTIEGKGAAESVSSYVERIAGLFGIDYNGDIDTAPANGRAAPVYSFGNVTTLAGRFFGLIESRINGQRRAGGNRDLNDGIANAYDLFNEATTPLQMNRAANLLLSAIQNLNADMKLVRQATRTFFHADTLKDLQKRVDRQQIEGLPSSEADPRSGRSFDFSDVPYSDAVLRAIAFQMDLERDTLFVKARLGPIWAHKALLERNEWDADFSHDLIVETEDAPVAPGRWDGPRDDDGTLLVEATGEMVEVDGEQMSGFNQRFRWADGREEALYVIGPVRSGRPIGYEDNTIIPANGRRGIVATSTGEVVNISWDQVARPVSDERQRVGSQSQMEEGRLPRAFSTGEDIDTVKGDARLRIGNDRGFGTSGRASSNQRQRVMSERIRREWASKYAMAIFGDEHLARRFFRLVEDGGEQIGVMNEEGHPIIGMPPEIEEAMRLVYGHDLPLPTTKDPVEYITELLSPKARDEMEVIEKARLEDSFVLRSVLENIQFYKTIDTDESQKWFTTPQRVTRDGVFNELRATLNSVAEKKAGSNVVYTNNSIEQGNGSIFTGLSGQFANSIPNVFFVYDSTLAHDLNGTTMELPEGHLIVFYTGDAGTVPNVAMPNIVSFALRDNPRLSSEIKAFADVLQANRDALVEAVWREGGDVEAYLDSITSQMSEEEAASFKESLSGLMRPELGRLYSRILEADGVLEVGGKGVDVVYDAVGPTMSESDPAVQRMNKKGHRLGIPFADRKTVAVDPVQLLYQILTDKNALRMLSFLSTPVSDGEHFASSLPMEVLAPLFEAVSLDHVAPPGDRSSVGLDDPASFNQVIEQQAASLQDYFGGQAFEEELEEERLRHEEEVPYSSKPPSSGQLYDKIAQAATRLRLSEEGFPRLSAEEFQMLDSMVNPSREDSTTYVSGLAAAIAKMMEAARSADKIEAPRLQRSSGEILERAGVGTLDAWLREDGKLPPNFRNVTHQNKVAGATTVQLKAFTSRYRPSTVVFRNNRLQFFESLVASRALDVRNLAADLHRRSDFLDTTFELDLDDDATLEMVLNSLRETIGEELVDGSISFERSKVERAKKMTEEIRKALNAVDSEIASYVNPTVGDLNSENMATLRRNYVGWLADQLLSTKGGDAVDLVFDPVNGEHLRALDTFREKAFKMSGMEIDRLGEAISKRESLRQQYSNLQKRKQDEAIADMLSSTGTIEELASLLDQRLGEMTPEARKAYEILDDLVAEFAKVNEEIRSAADTAKMSLESSYAEIIADSRQTPTSMIIDTGAKSADGDFVVQRFRTKKDSPHPFDFLIERDTHNINAIIQASMNVGGLTRSRLSSLYGKLVEPIAADNLPSTVEREFVQEIAGRLSPNLLKTRPKEILSFARQLHRSIGGQPMSRTALINMIDGMFEEGLTIENDNGKNVSVSPERINQLMLDHLAKTEKEQTQQQIYWDPAWREEVRKLENRRVALENELKSNEDYLNQTAKTRGKKILVPSVPTEKADKNDPAQITTVTLIPTSQDGVVLRGIQRAAESFAENYAERAYQKLRSHYGFRPGFDFDLAADKAVAIGRLREELASSAEHVAINDLIEADSIIGVSPLHVDKEINEENKEAYISKLDDDGNPQIFSLKMRGKFADRLVKIHEAMKDPLTGNKIVFLPEDGYSKWRETTRLLRGKPGKKREFKNLILHASLESAETEGGSHYFEVASLKHEFSGKGVEYENPTISLERVVGDETTSEDVALSDLMKKAASIVNDNNKVVRGKDKDGSYNNERQISLIKKQVTDIVRLVAYLESVKEGLTPFHQEALDNAKEWLSRAVLSNSQGRKMFVERIDGKALSITSVFADLFAASLGENLMLKIATGLRPTIGQEKFNFEYTLREWTYHQNARNRAYFGRNWQAYSQAIAIQHVLQNGWDGNTGREGYKTQLEKSLEFLGGTSKHIKRPMDQVMTIIKASLDSLEMAVDYNNETNKLNGNDRQTNLGRMFTQWFEGLQSGVSGINDYTSITRAKSKERRVGGIRAWWGDSHAALKDQTGITNEVFRMLVGTPGRNGIITRDELNTIENNKLTSEQAKDIIARIGKRFERRVKNASAMNEHISGLISVFRQVHSQNRTTMVYSADADGNYAGQRQIQSIVPLHFLEISNKDQEVYETDLGRGNSAMALADLQESKIYTRGLYPSSSASESIRRRMDRAHFVVDLNMNAAVQAVLDDSIRRINVTPNYMAFREIFGETETGTTETQHGKKRPVRKLTDDASIKRAFGGVEAFNDSETTKPVRMASYYIAHEIEENIRGELANKFDSTDFGDFAQAMNALYIGNRLVSINQFWRQSIWPVVGQLIKNKVFSNMTGQEGLNDHFMEAMKLAIQDVAGGNTGVSDFVRNNNVFLFYRNWDGTDDYRKTARKNFQVAKRGKNVYRRVTGMAKDFTAFKMDLVFAKTERVVTRAIYLSEMFAALQRNSDNPPSTIEEMISNYGHYKMDLLTRAEADIKTTDMMGISDVAKKAKVMNRADLGHRALNELLKTQMLFKNHMMTTSANMAASIEMLRDPSVREDERMKAEAVSNLVGTMVQNTLFTWSNFKYSVPLFAFALSALKSIFDDDDDDWRDVIEEASEWSDAVMKQDMSNDGNWFLNRLKAFVFKSGYHVFDYERYDGDAEAQMVASMVSGLMQAPIQEAMTGIPVIGPSLTQGPVWGDPVGTRLPAWGSDVVSGLFVEGDVNTRFSNSYRDDSVLRNAADLTTITASTYDIIEDIMMFANNTYDNPELMLEEWDYPLHMMLDRESRGGAKHRVKEKGHGIGPGKQFSESPYRNLFN